MSNQLMTTMDAAQDWFTSDSNWAVYATTKGIALPRPEDRRDFESITAAPLDIKAGRQSQLLSQQEWVNAHPLSSVGYDSWDFSVLVRDGAAINVKVSWPHLSRLQRQNKSDSDAKMKISLPVLFVTHGGGWIQGTHVSEEQWLLWPVYDRFDVIIISIEYRLGPEHKFPVWIEDSWDVLEQLRSDPDRFCPPHDLALDLQSIVLAGSSAGATISAALSQRCRDHGINIKGVVLNVPVLCHHQHLPQTELRALNKGNFLSYEQNTTAVLNSAVMKAVWDLAIPSDSEGGNPLASPLLGHLKDLPPHLIYVAGQDPLRDEGILYARRLEQEGVSVELKLYPGVPHIFAEMHELSATMKFWGHLKEGLAAMLT